MLEFENISFSFGNKTIFKSFSMSVPNGVSYALMAKSGRGKSTLFNIIAGLLKPQSGKIKIDGKISYSFQDARLIPTVTVLENLTVVLKNSPSSSETAKNILSEIGLAETVNMYPDELSGGMAKRVSIARALIYPSDIILLDEPFSGLDAETKRIVADIIQRYRNSRTLVSIIHDEAEADLLKAEIKYIDIANNYVKKAKNARDGDGSNPPTTVV